MTEERSDSVVDILQRSLGRRYRSGMDEGRAAMVRVLAEELSMERDQADELLRRLIESGQLRYVTADEHDHELDRDAQHDEHVDQANQTPRANQVGGAARASSGTLDPNEVPLAGGPLPGTGGIAIPSAGLPAAALGSGSGAPAAKPLPTSDLDATGGTERQGGYWDIRSETTGVVPSRSRKGQVEPKGT